MKPTLVVHFLSLVGAEVLSKTLTFLAFAFLARKFGSAGYGYVEWGAAILMCASLIVDLGFSSYGAREIAKTPERSSLLVSEIVTARLLLGVVAYAGVTLLAVFGVTDPPLRSLLLTFGVSLLLLPFLLQWAFQGHERMHLVSVTQFVRQAVFATVVFLFVNNIGDIVIVGLAEVAAVGLAAALCVLLYLKSIPRNGRLSLRLSSDTFHVGGTIGLSQLFWVVKMFGATVIIGLIATAGETGKFGAAMRLFIAVHTFVWLYFFNLLPSLSRAWTNDRAEFARLIRGSMRLVVAVAVPACVVGLILAPYIMGFIYGSEFIEGAGALRWMGIACLLTAISGHFRFGLLAAGRQSREMMSSAAGAATTIMLLPAGYFIGGITFAALGLCFAEAVILFVSWLQSWQLLDTDDRPIIAAAAYRAGVTSKPQSAR